MEVALNCGCGFHQEQPFTLIPIQRYVQGVAIMRNFPALATFTALLAATSGFALAQDDTQGVTRTYSNPTARIASTASVAEGSKLVFLSGTTPLPLDPAAPEILGDTRQQTLSVLTRMKEQLESMGMDMGDLVKLTVFLVGVPELDGRMDSAAMNEVFSTFFGTEAQPHRPTRSTIQVAALGRPGMYVEIEGIAAVAPGVTDQLQVSESDIYKLALLQCLTEG
jgi:2-iminobutanoate/2-iminopropanoate deaminase